MSMQHLIHQLDGLSPSEFKRYKKWPKIKVEKETSTFEKPFLSHDVSVFLAEALNSVLPIR